jgi:Spy/CpxP family protein refolding chaperone
MKFLVLAASLLAVGASSASAQYGGGGYGGGGHGGWNRDIHPYAQRHHSVCQSKAIRLHQYEDRALRNDGRLDRRERATIEALKNDLDRTCGRHRHRG